MEILPWDRINTLSTAALTLGGLILSIWQGRLHHGLKWVSFALFIFFWAVSHFAQEQLSEDAKIKAGTGANFLYVRPEIGLNATSLDKFPLMIHPGKDGPMFDVQVHIHTAESKGNVRHPGYWGPGRTLPLVRPWGEPLGIALGVGQWRMEINDRNNHWIQHLDIYETPGGIMFGTSLIQRGGGKIKIPSPS